MLISTFHGWLLVLLGLLAGSAQAQRLAAGYNYSLSIHADGTLWAWGLNNYGQLGTGDLTYRTTPVQVGTATNWQSVAAGETHVVATRTDGTLWTWGNTNYDYFSSPSASQKTPVQLGTAAVWQSVAAGSYFSLAIRTDGALCAWGVNSNYGQFGTGSSYIANPRTTPAQVGMATNWQSVAAGYAHGVAVRRDGTLWTWGSNLSGELGNGTASTGGTPITQVGTATTWQSVAAGDGFSLATRTDGTLWSWGGNFYGQLGTSTGISSKVPQQVGTSTNWQRVAAGVQHAAAVQRDGTLWAWGRNTFGQAGPDGTPLTAPTQVGTATGWQDVAAGYSHTLALRADGTLWAWGDNTKGQVGTGSPAARIEAPVQVGTATTWQSVGAGNAYSVALRADGTLWTWGQGYGTTTNSPNVPTQIGTATTWQSVAAGPNHTLAVRRDGTLWAWGNNFYGQLGTGAAGASQNLPRQVGTATTWQSVAAGDGKSAALRRDGTLWTWGSNSGGALGLGNADEQDAPVQVGTATTWQQVAIGTRQLLVIRADGTLWSCGLSNFGELGNGQVTSYVQGTLRQVGTATTWQSVVAADGKSAALRRDGTLWTWGRNDDAQLGNGTTTQLAAPGQVGSPASWLAVALGEGHGLALRADGTLWSWGRNDNSQLGYGSPANPLPVYIAGGGAVLATAAPAPATSGWGLAPNPARGPVQLLGLPAGPVAVNLFDAQGRLVRTAATATVPTMGLAPGLYLLRVRAGAASRTLRLVVE